MRKLLLFAIALGFLSGLSAKGKDAEAIWKENDRAALTEFKRLDDANYDLWRDNILLLWNNFQQSDGDAWVAYSAKGACYSRADWQKNNLELKVLVPAKETTKAAEIASNHLQQLFAQKGGDLVVLTKLVAPDNTVIDANNSGDLGAAFLQQAKADTLRGADGNIRTAYTWQLSIPVSEMARRRGTVLNMVKTTCARLYIEPALVLSLMQAESGFNPRAYNSRSGATGLLQIMPQQAGRDMCKKYLKKDMTPTREMLEDPQTNITLGVGYLLTLHEFYRAQNVDKLEDGLRDWCLITGWSLGKATLYYVFTGKTDVPDWNKFPEFTKGWDGEKLYRELLAKTAAPRTKAWLEQVHTLLAVYRGPEATWP